MRLGVVGMLPDDFRRYTPAQMQAIAALGFTGFGCHLDGEMAAEITGSDCRAFAALYDATGLELAQFSLSYNECLFAPEPGIRAAATEKIGRGIELARWLGAHGFLIRPGSLNPAGPWTPHRDNHLPQSLARLIATLRPLAARAEAEGVLLVMETHAISIVDSPEVCAEVVEAVGSDKLRIVMDAVNHFQSLRQVYRSADRLNQIFDVMGAIAPLAHIKDIAVRNSLVLHLDEEVPGEGELDIGLLLRRFQALHPDGYGLIEHLPIDKVPLANANVRRIAAKCGVPIA
ncbi:MAG TPA: sugar phosphate isomerase/epimerase family protein [Roseiflexaceae bacterium]|nr:sugar phosphate isomerase/epimerase family protein [Roseiflexaceae bacterium]